MTNWEPNKLARCGGFLYLLIIVISIYGELFVRASLVDVVNIEATTNNIIGSLNLWKLTLALDYLLIVSGITLAYLYFSLFKHIGKNTVVLFLFFYLSGFAVEAVSKVNLLSIQIMLEQPLYLESLDPQILHAQIQQALSLYTHNFNLGMLIFGCAYLVLGALIHSSQIFPRVLGRMMQIAGLCYISNTLMQLVAHDVFLKISPAILLPAFIAEMSLCLWLLIFGVKNREDGSINEKSLAQAG